MESDSREHLQAAHKDKIANRVPVTYDRQRLASCCYGPFPHVALTNPADFWKAFQQVLQAAIARCNTVAADANTPVCCSH